jgi:hypothetical protein
MNQGGEAASHAAWLGSIPIVSTVGSRRSGFARGDKKIAIAIERRSQ